MPHRTLIDALLAAPADRPFVTMWNNEEDASGVTFGQFTSMARVAAAQFREHGTKKGDTVILIMPQGIDVMVAFAGAMMLGAVPAILAYPNFKVEPGKYRFGLAGVTKNLRARLIVLDENFPAEMLGHVEVGEGAKVIRASAFNGSAAIDPVHSAPDDVAFIQHSAGTTGLQKGVALSHAAVIRQINHLAASLRLAGDSDRIYSWLPLYHDMGLIACFMLPMTCHVPIVMQSPTDWVMQPGTMLKLIGDYKCSLAWVPNFTLQFLARRVHPDDRVEYKLDSLRAIVNCSEPVRGQSMDEFLAAYASNGLRENVLHASYAMAENVFAITQTPVDKPIARLWVDPEKLRNEHVASPVSRDAVGAVSFVSSGRLLPSNEVRVMSNEGVSLGEGHIGELIVRSDSLFTGYYNRPDLTEKALKDGWYWTGDLGFILDGEVYVIGRKKDLIIVAGKNIYPQDVEEIVFSHPKIHDGRAVAFGMYNASLGTEDIVVLAEVSDEKDLGDALAIERAVKSAIVAELGVAARAVYLKPPKWIVKSTAGKPARAATKEKLIKEHPELAS